MKVGDRFTKADARSYTENGAKGVHEVTVLAEVTSTDAVGFDYAVVDVVAESGRPAFAGNSRPTGGSMAWFGWDAAVARGDAKAV